MWRDIRLEYLMGLGGADANKDTFTELEIAEIRRCMAGKLHRRDKKWGISADFLVTGNMLLLAKPLLARATTRLWNQDESGWSQLLRAWRYCAWAEMLRLEWTRLGILDRSPGPAERGPAIYVLAVAVAYGRRDFAAYFLPRVAITWEMDLYDYQTSPLPEFLLRLAAKWIDYPLQIPDGKQFCKLGKYAAIFDSWDDPERIVKVIRWMADERILDWKSHRTMMIVGHDVVRDFPAEIFSVYRVRRDLGAETPPCPHPALEPLYDRLPPDGVQPEHDALLEEVIAWARQKTPSLADCPI